MNAGTPKLVMMMMMMTTTTTSSISYPTYQLFGVLGCFPVIHPPTAHLWRVQGAPEPAEKWAEAASRPGRCCIFVKHVAQIISECFTTYHIRKNESTDFFSRDKLWKFQISLRLIHVTKVSLLTAAQENPLLQRPRFK